MSVCVCVCQGNDVLIFFSLVLICFLSFLFSFLVDLFFVFLLFINASVLVFSIFEYVPAMLICTYLSYLPTFVFYFHLPVSLPLVIPDIFVCVYLFTPLRFPFLLICPYLFYLSTFAFYFKLSGMYLLTHVSVYLRLSIFHRFCPAFVRVQKFIAGLYLCFHFRRQCVHLCLSLLNYKSRGFPAALINLIPGRTFTFGQN